MSPLTLTLSHEGRGETTDAPSFDTLKGTSRRNRSFRLPSFGERGREEQVVQTPLPLRESREEKIV
jgi:hypothetical protein